MEKTNDINKETINEEGFPRHHAGHMNSMREKMLSGSEKSAMDNDEHEEHEDHGHHHEHGHIHAEAHEHHHDHDHDHDHAHHHDHDHDHEHHHEHGEGCTCDDCVSGVSVIHHEGALAGSFSAEAGRSLEETDAILKEGMQALAKKVDSHGGIIGHIKSAVSSGEDSYMYSITSDTVQRKGTMPEGAVPDQITFASIVFGMEEDELRESLVEIREKLIKS